MKLPIITDNLIINEFKNSDFGRLRDIAININNKADKKDGYMPFYAFQVGQEEINRQKKISQKVANFIHKCNKEKSEEPRTTYRLAIRNKDSNYLIGNVTINMLPVEENGRLIYGDRGCFIDPNFAKKGYAVEATRAVTHIFFQKYDEMDVTAHPDNINSRKLIERSGGKQIGTKESSYGQKEPRAIFKIKKEDFYKACAINYNSRETKIEQIGSLKFSISNLTPKFIDLGINKKIGEFQWLTNPFLKDNLSRE